MKTKKQKKPKPKFVDDGRTVFDMSALNGGGRFGMGGDKPNIKAVQETQTADDWAQQKAHKKAQAKLERVERRALIRAAFKAYLPFFGCVLVGLLFAMLLVSLWLH